MTNSGVFITGTDTGVGKTTIACHLIKALEASGLQIAVRKPVESGCRKSKDRLIAEDAERLAEASVSKPSVQQVCRYQYQAAVSPSRAAMLAGETLYIDQLAACCDDKQFTVVEGAGGLLSPIATDGLNIDLIAALGFSVIVVAADRLGCINHVLLTLEALAARSIQVIAVVLNRMHPQSDATELDNYHELGALIDIPIVQVYKNDIADAAISKLVKLIIETNP